MRPTDQELDDARADAIRRTQTSNEVGFLVAEVEHFAAALRRIRDEARDDIPGELFLGRIAREALRGPRR